MKRNLQVLAIILMGAFSAQSFGMMRLFNGARLRLAPRACSLGLANKRLLLPHTPVHLKSTNAMGLNRARMRLAGALGFTAAGMALYSTTAKAEGKEKPSAAEQNQPAQSMPKDMLVSQGYLDVYVRAEKELVRTEALIQAQKRTIMQHTQEKKKFEAIIAMLDSSSSNSLIEYLKSEVVLIDQTVESIKKQLTTLASNQIGLKKLAEETKAKMAVK